MEYDLTEYQARVYLALLDLGVAAASQIPSIANVPRTRIYATMRQLHGKGLVTLLPERPLRYRAAPIATYIHGLAQDYRSRASQLIGESENLSRDFPITMSRSAETKGRFEALYGRRNVRDRIQTMYEEAKESIIAIGSTKSPGRLRRAFGPLIQAKANEGLSIKLAFYIAPENLADVRALGKFTEVRGIDFFTPVFRHGVDDREFLMGHPVPDDDSTARGDDIAIWTNDREIAAAMAQMAERIWAMGKPLSRGAWKAPRRLRVTPDES
jgi:HTH-type transcriptional regulator, sugar sensing transcriptional regulator